MAMPEEPLYARTLPKVVRAGARSYPDREAIVDGPVRLTFADLADQVTTFARALIAQGVSAGDRVAIWAPNSWRWSSPPWASSAPARSWFP